MPFLKKASAFAKSNLSSLWAPDFSRLLVCSDSAGWSLDEDAKAMLYFAGSAGVRACLSYRPLPALRQCVHYTNSFSLLERRTFDSKHRISVDYYHGKPGQAEVFQRVFDRLRANAGRISRLRVSYSEMRNLALEAGVDPAAIFLIPIGVEPGLFHAQTVESKKAAREKLGLPEAALVVGSFQKDGEGWGEGDQPKWVKGPDVLVQVFRRLREKFPELVVLLSGPSRGYVKKALAADGIPFRHVYLQNYQDVRDCYQAIDLYVVSSREEGGPKAILESMASGVPLVTTRVGQAIDLVRNGENAMMASVDDIEALAGAAESVLQDSQLRSRLVRQGLLTASGETYEAQIPRWREYFRGLVEP